jgi:hypothetical protein
MAMIQSILKKEKLAKASSLKYYYNSKRRLLEKSESELELDEIFKMLHIQKIMADFKLNRHKPHNSKNFKIY